MIKDRGEGVSVAPASVHTYSISLRWSLDQSGSFHEMCIVMQVQTECLGSERLQVCCSCLVSFLQPVYTPGFSAGPSKHECFAPDGTLDKRNELLAARPSVPNQAVLST